MSTAIEHLGAGDDAERFFIDAALAQAVKTLMPMVKPLVDVPSARCLALRRRDGYSDLRTTRRGRPCQDGTIDGVCSTIGSTNLDWRSYLHNDEVNAVVLGGAL